MRNNAIQAVFSAVLLFCAAVSVAHSEEDLFDVKTAALYIEQGTAYLKAGDLDSAIDKFEESAAVNPDAQAYYFLGYAYYLKSKRGDAGSREQARENFGKAYELDPGFSPSGGKTTAPDPSAR
jgi:tetratricopeptide (TPR) repeat protein